MVAYIGFDISKIQTTYQSVNDMCLHLSKECILETFV